MFFKQLGTVLTILIASSSCKNPGLGDQSPAIAFSSVISFGDSLSDAGTYQVGPIKAAGGGLFTVNGVRGKPGASPVPSYTWAQLVSAAAIGYSSCAARTGGYGSPEGNETALSAAKCRNYAQGGARVTDPKGVGNPVGVGFIAGPLTEPVVTQIANFSADNGSTNFDGNELITVLAGPNDLFAQIDILTEQAKAAGSAAFGKSLITQLVTGAAAANRAQAQTTIALAVQAEAALATATPTTIIAAALKAANPFLTAPVNPVEIGKIAEVAGKEAASSYAATTGLQNALTGLVAVAETLGGYVKDMVDKGARYVVVVNIPDVSQTPLAAKNPASQPLILALTMAFNSALEKATANSDSIVFVDAFSENQRQFINPAHYDLDNVKDVACNLNFPANVADTAKNGSGSSIVCNGGNLNNADTIHYLFADNVHPTPYGHKLLAQYVTKAMVLAGWL